MKNRLFPIVMGLCFVLIVGMAFLLASGPQNETPVKTDSVQESAKPAEVSETEDVAITAETTPQISGSEKTVFGMDIEKAKELLNSEDFENFKNFENAEDSQKFLEKLKSSMSPEQLAKIEEAEQAAKNWFDGFGLDGLEAGDKMPDMDMQELYDILGPAFGAEINFSETAMKVFRGQFPEGEPADYEPQMAQRIHELVATTSGDFEEVFMGVFMELIKEHDFTAWTMGQFQGKIGQQIEWMKGEIIVAGQMEGIEYTVPEDMSKFVNPLTKAGTQKSTTPTQTPPDTTSKRELVDVLSTLLNRNRDAKTLPTEGISPPLPPARVAAIRETLSLHGTKAGMLHLLENDKEAADWLLKQFGTPAKVEAWLSEQGTKTPTPPVPPEIKP
ncbi:hypothetical protein C6501_11110 [Candidatus Poribacteria bacterium]|nr:MAG: hypothetical protein C6501_11110 [Candidatus Poribacteria bacterium]